MPWSIAIVPAGDPADIRDIADDDAGNDRSDTEQAGQGRARGPDRRSQHGATFAQLGVQVAQVSQELSGQLFAHRHQAPSSAFQILRISAALLAAAHRRSARCLRCANSGAASTASTLCRRQSRICPALE
jgi:hypothetical protein